MAVDTPARIAVVGAGPIGLEAALYARYLGYTVDVYERGRIAENLLRQGHVRPFTPWDMNVTTLGVAALRSQDEAWLPAGADESLTYHELVVRYFLPLANSDLLSDGIQEGAEVLGVAREGLSRRDFVGDPERRADAPFRILLRDVDGRERVEHADVVLDCSGTLGSKKYLGCSGLPAVGELGCRDRIEYEIPDVLGAENARYLGKQTLVIGGGHSAATTITSLAALSAKDRATQITWVTRRKNERSHGPIEEIEKDPFPQRVALAHQANLLATKTSGPVEYVPQTHVEAVSFDESTGKFSVEFGGCGEGHREFDRIVANLGHGPCIRAYDEIEAADSLYGKTVGWLEPVRFIEPDYYVLGAKSFGRTQGFNLTIGREQVRALYAILGDREGLNLYETNRHFA